VPGSPRARPILINGGFVETILRKKILLAVDGSDQALEAVRYISTITAPDATQIVLFHVGSGFPEVFFDMNKNPLYHSKKSPVMGWLAENQLVMGEFKEKAFKIFATAGFPNEAILVKTQTRKTGILKDILQESYQGYHAVAVGRTGMSWLKDLVMGSLAYKLSYKIRHMPIIVVGGQPTSHKILLALDDSTEAMRAVYSVGQLADGRDIEVTLCHVLILPGMFRTSAGELVLTEREQDWLAYNTNKFRPIMAEAAQRLIDEGIRPDCIQQHYICHKGNPIQQVIKFALEGHFGTVVVGRRKASSFFKELIWGRFSDTIIKSTDNMAVWVSN
jgi:nucleotide-binding universal stress UspA family protein